MGIPLFPDDGTYAAQVAAWGARKAPLQAVLLRAGCAESTRIEEQERPTRWKAGYLLDEASAHGSAILCYHWDAAYRGYHRLDAGQRAHLEGALYQYRQALEAAGYLVRRLQPTDQDEPYLVIVPPAESLVPHD